MRWARILLTNPLRKGLKIDVQACFLNIFVKDLISEVLSDGLLNSLCGNDVRGKARAFHMKNQDVFGFLA